MLNTELANGARPTREVPAWVLSVAVHAAMFVLLGLLYRSTAPKSVDEGDRPVGIVLASTATLEEENSQLQEDIQQPTDQASSAASANSESTTAETAAGDGLPPASAAAEQLLAEIPLPGSPTQVTAAENPVHTPSLTGSAAKRGLPGLSREEAARILADDPVLNRPPPPSGPTASIALFGGGAAEGRTFVFAIDRSKSMGGEGLGALSAAEKELRGQLEKLSPMHRFQIIAYHHKPVYFSDAGMALATEDNKSKVGPFFGGLAAFGGTQHRGALFAALRLKPDVVFLLTDGGDPYLNANELRDIQKRAGGRTSIHCIQFGFGPLQETEGFMRRLARQNGGGFVYVDMSRAAPSGGS